MCKVKVKNNNPLRISTEQEELWICAQLEAGIKWKSAAECLKQMEKKSGQSFTVSINDYKRIIKHSGISDYIPVL